MQIRHLYVNYSIISKANCKVMEKFSSKIHNLAIQSESDSARGDASITEAEKKLQEKLGTIFSIVELFGTPDEFSDGFFEIINDLKTEYYLPPFDLESGTEKRFEECLQRANRRVSKLIARSIAKVELKDINALLGLVYQNKVYLSQIGKNNAFLFRQRRDRTATIVDIFGQASDKKLKIDPEKMFSNIISGEITLVDQLFFCNDTVLEFLSQLQLSEIILDNDIFSAANWMERELQPHSANNNFYAVIVEPITPTISTEPISRSIAQTREDQPIHPQTSINRLIDTQAKTEQYLTPSLMPNWKKVLILLLIWIRRLAKYTYKYLKIGSIALWGLLQELFIKLKRKILKQPLVDSTPIEMPKAVEADNRIVAQEDDLTDISDIRIPTESASIKTLPLSGKINIFHATSHFLNKHLARFTALSVFQKILFITAFVLIFLFSQSIVMKGQAGGRAKLIDIDNITQQATEAINSAEAQNVFNDEAGAKESLAQAIELFNKIPDKRKYQEVRTELQNKIDQLSLLLQKMTYITEPELIADLNNKNAQAQTKGLAKINSLIFTFDNQNQTLYKIDTDKKQTISIQLSGLGTIKKIDALNDKSIVLLNDKNEFYQYDIAGNSTSTKKVLTVDTPVADFSVYSGKIYTLQADKNQVFKHLPAGNGFNSGSTWLKDNTPIKDASALAIGDGIFLLRTAGAISHFVDGKLQPSQYSATTPPMTAPIQIDTDAESNYVYLLDPQNQRVVVYDKNGSTKIQYSSKQFSDIKSMAITSKEKKIYLLSGNQIYGISTNF